VTFCAVRLVCRGCSLTFVVDLIVAAAPSRDLFESENWIEVDDIVNRVYPMNADASSDSSTLSTGGGMFLGNSISGADICSVLAKAQV